MKKFGRNAILIIGAFIILIVAALSVKAQIQSIAGLAVAQTATKWNNLKDAAAGTTGLTTGVGTMGMFLNNGGQFDMATGDPTNGMKVQLTAVPVSGTSFFAITKTNLGTSSSNQAFGFTSKKVAITAPSTNTANVCIDWLGGTAVCPAADTAGDDVFPAGKAIILDDYAVTSISAIAASGTQTIVVEAWN